jgi:hypothetical protein
MNDVIPIISQAFSFLIVAGVLGFAGCATERVLSRKTRKISEDVTRM